MKAQYRFFIFIGICILLLFLIDESKEKALDWRPYLSHDSKKPLGAYALYEILPSFTQNENEIISEPLITQNLAYSGDSKSIFILNTDFQELGDEYDSDILYECAKQGRTVFIASGQLPETLRDSLNIEIRTEWKGQFSFGGPDTLNSVILLNPGLTNKRFDFRTHGFFSKIFVEDSSSTTVLSSSDDGDAIFVKVKVGDGEFLIHTMPEAFGNFYLMSAAHQKYIYGCLSYLPELPLLWDEYYKDFSRHAQTPIRFILQSESLRSAYYLLLLSLVLYVIFMGKRRQRAIPVIQPPANATLDFVKTIGKLYHQHADHTGLAKKKLNFFMDYVRSKLFIQTDINKTELAKLISDKTSFSLANTLEILRYAERIDEGYQISNTELSSLHSLLEGFYKHNK